MNLFVISLFLFSNCVLIQTRVSNLPEKFRARINNRKDGECPCFPKAQLLDNKRLKDRNIERLVVYLFKNKNSNEIEVFTPNPVIQKLIPNFRYGERIKTVTTETIESLFQKPGNEINNSDQDDDPIGVIPGIVENISVKPDFFQTEQDPHENCGFDSQNPKHLKLSSENIETVDNISFDQWFYQQIETLQNVHLLKHSQSINNEILRSQVQKTLVDNDMAINPSGIITDSSGAPINLDNLQLRPILIGDSDINQQISKGVNKHIPYLEGIIVTLIDPPKVLNVIDLGKTYITKTSPAKTPETRVYGSIRHYETGLKGLLSKPSQMPDSTGSSSERAKRSASSYFDSHYQYPRSNSANYWHPPSHNWQSYFNPASTDFHSYQSPYSSTPYENIWPMSSSGRKKRSVSSYYRHPQGNSANQRHSHSYYPSTYYPQSSHSNPNWPSHLNWSPSWGSSTPYKNIWPASYSERKKRSAHSPLDSYYPYSQRSSVNQRHSNSYYPSTYDPQSSHSNPNWQSHSHWWDSSAPYENIWPAPYSARKKRSASYYPYSQSSSATHWYEPNNPRHSYINAQQSLHSNNWQSQPYVINPALTESHSHWSSSWGSPCTSDWCPSTNDNIWPASYSRRKKRSVHSSLDSYYPYSQSSSTNHLHGPNNQGRSHSNYPYTNYPQSSHSNPNWQSHSYWSPSWGSSTPYENIWPASFSARKKRSAHSSLGSYYPYSQSSSVNNLHEHNNQGYSHSYYPYTNYPQSSHSNPNRQSHSHWSPSGGSSTSHENIWPASYSGRKKRSAHSSLDSYYPYSQSSSVNQWHEPNNQKHSHSYYLSTNYPQSSHSNPNWPSHAHSSPSWGSFSWNPTPNENWSLYGRKKRSASSSVPYPKSSNQNYWHIHSSHPITNSPISSPHNPNWQYQPYVINPALTEFQTPYQNSPPNFEGKENSDPIIANPYPPPNINIWPAYQNYEIKFEPNILLIKDTDKLISDTENVTHPGSEHHTKDSNANSGDSNTNTDSEHTDISNLNKELATEPSKDLPDIDTIKSVIEIFLDNMSQTLIKKDNEHGNKAHKSGSTRKSGDSEGIEVPDYRIIGGSAATGSGSPVSNKGRSGIVV